MSKTLSKEQQAVWDRLNHVPLSRGGNAFDEYIDINSMYPTQITGFNFTRITVEKHNAKLKVLKSR